MGMGNPISTFMPLMMKVLPMVRRKAALFHSLVQLAKPTQGLFKIASMGLRPKKGSYFSKPMARPNMGT